jgi:dihydropteroate synthase
MDKTKIVAILNVTPDSFSDGGKFNSYQNAIDHIWQLINQGADIIDIGAESTRPGGKRVGIDEEWQRLEIILPQLVDIIWTNNLNPKNKKIAISIDSRNLETAKKAHQAGVNIINDVNGLKDKKMAEFVINNNLEVVFMHSLTIPVDPTIIIDHDLDIVAEIISFAKQKITELMAMGAKKKQLIFDPGIGFGKDSDQSIEILKRIDEFRILDLPLYIGHSKKRFLDKLDFEQFQKIAPNLCEFKPEEFNNFSREQKTSLISQYLTEKKIEFIRVHDVKDNIFTNNLKNYI